MKFQYLTEANRIL